MTTVDPMVSGTSRQGSRTARCAIALSSVVALLSPLIADTNATHLTNPAWPPHARFHGVVVIALMVGAGATSIAFLLLRVPPQAHRVRVVAAAVLPIYTWASFFVAAAVPGTSSWPDGSMPFFPVAPNMVIAAIMAACAALGLWLELRAGIVNK